MRRTRSSRATAATRRASCSRPTMRPPILFDLGTGLRPYARTVRRASSTARCCCRTSTGTTCRACRSSCRCTVRARPSTCTARARTTARSARCSREMMRPPFFPIRPTSWPATCASTTPATTTSRSGCAKVRSRWVRHVGPTLGFRVEWNGVSIAYLPDHGPGCDRRARRRLHPARGARAVRRCRRADPRRAAHAGRVRAEAALGSLHDRLRGARRPRSRARGAWCCSTTIPRTATTTSTVMRARTRPTTPPASAGAEVIAGYEGLEIELAPAHAGTRMSSSPQGDPRRPTPAAIRTVLGHFATGVAIITAMDGDEPVGMACNSFTSVSLEPQLVLFCAAKSSSTWPRIQAAQKWAANILDEDGEQICRLFAQKGADRFAHIAYTTGPHRCADARRRAIAFVDCETIAEHDAGDHLIVVGPGASSSATRPRASRCSSTAAGTGASRSRAPDFARARRSRSARWMPRRGRDDRDHRFGDREQPADERRCRARTRGSRRRGSPAASASWARTVDARRCRARHSVSPTRGRPGRDPALVDAGGARWPAGRRARRSRAARRAAGNEPRRCERRSRRAGRRPPRPARPDRSGRRPPRPADSPRQPKPAPETDRRGNSVIDTDHTHGHRSHNRLPLFPKRARLTTLRVQGDLGGVRVSRRRVDRSDERGDVQRGRARRHGRRRRAVEHARRQPDPRVDAPRPAVDAWCSCSRRSPCTSSTGSSRTTSSVPACRTSVAEQMQILLPRRADRRPVPRARRSHDGDGQVAARALRRERDLDLTLDDVVGLGPVQGRGRQDAQPVPRLPDVPRADGRQPAQGRSCSKGPPGTGKTYMAKAMAHEAGVPFLFVSSTAFQSMYYGADRPQDPQLLQGAAQGRARRGWRDRLHRGDRRDRRRPQRHAQRAVADGARSARTHGRAQHVERRHLRRRQRAAHPDAVVRHADRRAQVRGLVDRPGEPLPPAAPPHPEEAAGAVEHPASSARRTAPPTSTPRCCARVGSTVRSTSTSRAARAGARSSTTTSTARRTCPSSTRRSGATRSRR